MRIILITNSFPYGLAEKSFIAPEFEVLSKMYDFTIVSRNKKDEQTTDVGEKTPIYRYDGTNQYNFVLLLCRTLLKKAVYKDIYTAIKKGYGSIKTVKRIITVMMRSIHFSDYLKKVREEYSEDIIFYTYWNDYATLACTMVKHNNDRIISRIHGADLYLNTGRVAWQTFKDETNSKIDRLFFISKRGLEYYKDVFQDCGEKMHLCYLGVKERKAAPFSEHNGIKIISFSYLSPVKRIDLIINTLSKIEDTEIEWTHIGGGVLEKELLQLAQEKLNNKKNIQYNFTGYMQNEDALEYVCEREFDFLLNVSFSEGLPVTMMEAMSMGIPVVATNVGGVNEIVSDGINGFLIERDFEEQTLINVFDRYNNLSFKEKKELREKSVMTWEYNFYDKTNYEIFAKEIKELYD